MGNVFPLYVRLDDRELIRIESKDQILCALEAIDIENDEYLFWDAAGKGIKVLLSRKVDPFRNPTVDGFRAVENSISFQDAAQQWATQVGIQVDTTGDPQQVWDRVNKAQASLPHRRSRVSRLFAIGMFLIVPVLVVLAFWCYDIWQDSRHVISVLADTPVYVGHGSDVCGGNRLAIIHQGTKLPVHRVRYWKNCATLDTTLVDGRDGYIVLGDGSVSITPPLHAD